MSGTDRLIKWSNSGCCTRRRGMAAVASYKHAYDLVRAHGESGWAVCLIPLTVGGLIYASSMVMPDSTRRLRQP
jgi:hypothetical protein